MSMRQIITTEVVLLYYTLISPSCISFSESKKILQCGDRSIFTKVIPLVYLYYKS